MYNNRALHQSQSWLYDVYIYWFMSPEVTENAMWFIKNDGILFSVPLSDSSYVFGTRPTFHLNADVLYTGGNGSKETPYRLGLNA